MILKFNFVGPTDENNISILLNYIEKQTEPIERLDLNISSSGGNLTPAIALYHYLKSLPFEIATHNIGEVSSAAVLPYLAGSIRTAEPRSRFTIHPIRSGGNNMCYFQIEELLVSLRTDIKNYADIVNQETNALNGKANVMECLQSRGIVFGPELADELGITMTSNTSLH